MGRAARPPKYPAKSHASGQARIRCGGRDIYLGPFGSPESQAAYKRMVAEWAATPVPTVANVRSVADLIDAILSWSARRYSGGPMAEQYRYALQPVFDLYRDVAVEQFGPVALKTCRASMLVTCCRNTANQRTRMLQFAWREAVSAELIPADLAARLDTVSGLPLGAEGTRDYEEVGPVPEADLAATLPHLPPVLRALVELQLLTGARPGELVTLRPADLHRGERVELRKGHYLELAGCWARVFRGVGVAKRLKLHETTRTHADAHKTAHYGHTRVLLFGQRAQSILAPLLDGLSAGDPVFRTSHGTPYTTRTYCRGVARAVELASRTRACEACRAARAQAERSRRSAKAGVARARPWRPWLTCETCAAAAVAHWHCHQLRHNSASIVVAQFGYEVGRLILGHKTLAMTARYALDPLAAAIPAVAALEAAAVRLTAGNGVA